MTRVTLGRLARLSVAGTLVAYTLWTSHPREVWTVARGARPALLGAAVLLVLLDRALMAWRWSVLLRSLDRTVLPSFGTILRIFFVSTFVGSFLPASIGGDAVRAFSLSRHRVGAGDAVASVLLDRMLGVLSLLLLGLVGLVLVGDAAPTGAIRLAVAVTGLGCLVGTVLVFSSRAERWGAAWCERLPFGRIRALAAETITALRRYAAHRAALLVVLAASTGVQLLRVVQAYLIGTALGMTQPIPHYVALVPLVLLVMLLPVTVNGIGTSQAAFILLFRPLGTPDAEAFALSVLFVALGLVGNLPGAFLYASRRPVDGALASGSAVTTGAGER